VCLDVADVVAAERALDLLEVRQLARLAGDALGSCGVDVQRAACGAALGLDGAAEQ
jgi:hypothetical protein